MYPLTQQHKFRARVHRSIDFSEQRYNMGTQLAEFELQYTNINTADKETLRVFFADRFGEWDTAWEITVDGVTYDGMQFSGPQFQAQEQSEGLWNVVLRCRQTLGT